ncbi:MAG: CBS domain-containing protein [Bacillota bacterium]
MTRDVSTVSQNSTVNDAAGIMRDLNVGAVPVCKNNNEPVGIVTDRDIVLRNIASGGNGSASVRNVMTSNIIYGTPDMDVNEAARLMAQKQIRRLPICENNKIIGMLSLGDLAVKQKSDMEAARALSSISIPSKPNKK